MILSSTNPVSLFRRIWPTAVVGVVLIGSAIWTGFLGYELFQLVFQGASSAL